MEERNGEEVSSDFLWPYVSILSVQLNGQKRETMRSSGFVHLLCWIKHVQRQKYSTFSWKLLFWHPFQSNKPHCFPRTRMSELNRDFSDPAIWLGSKTPMIAQGINVQLESRLWNRLSSFLNKRLCTNWKSSNLERISEQTKISVYLSLFSG